MFSGVLDGIMSSGVLDGNNTDEENVTLFRGDVVSRHCLATLRLLTTDTDDAEGDPFGPAQDSYVRNLLTTDDTDGVGPAWSGPRHAYGAYQHPPTS